MPKTKIAHIITSLELGGAQKTTLSLLAHMDKQDYEAHLITSPGGLLLEEARAIACLKLFPVTSLRGEISPAKDILSLWQIAGYLKREKISIVHTHSSKAGILGRLAARLAGVKIVFHTVHGWPFYIETNAAVKFCYRLLERVASWLTTRLIVVSDADLKAGLTYVNRDRARYAKIYYGIESKDFHCPGCAGENRGGCSRELSGRKEKACVVGGIFCFKPQKAPLDFVRTARAVIDKDPDVRFISIGDGPLRPAAEKLSLESGLNGRMKFLGWQKDVSFLFSEIDILLLTSRWEGLPVVFLEAMASGVPVVATDVGGACEIIKSGVNGFLEEKGACARLADDILLLARNPGKRKEFSERARDTFRREFDISHMARQIQGVYKDELSQLQL